MKLKCVHSSFPVIHKIGNFYIFVLLRFEKTLDIIIGEINLTNLTSMVTDFIKVYTCNNWSKQRARSTVEEAESHGHSHLGVINYFLQRSSPLPKHSSCLKWPEQVVVLII